MAAEKPRNRKNRVYVHPSILIFQSHWVVKICAQSLKSFGHVTPTARDRGSQNTEKP
jgi:hypothetical protein